MADTDFGPKKQKIAKRLIGALIDFANKSIPSIQGLKCSWKESKPEIGKETLNVESPSLTHLRRLIRDYERIHHPATSANKPELTDAVLDKELGNVLRRLEDQIEILTFKIHPDEAKTNRTGPRKKGWAFTLTLPSLNHNACLADFDVRCENRDKSLSKTGTLSPRPKAITDTISHNLPISGTPTFLGRDNEVSELSRFLHAEGVNLLAVVGMAGVGKTELLLQYATQNLAKYSGGICWVYARDFAIEPQIVGFAQARLNLVIPDGLELKEQLAFCFQNWKEGQVLLVIDDLIDYGHIRDILTFNRARFHIVITTRLKLSTPVTVLDLSVLSEAASLTFLECEALVGQSRIQEEIAIARSLCDWLGHLPLGLELVGRYLNQEPDLSLAEMLFRLQTTDLRDESISGDAKEDETWSLTARRGVAAAFELSWKKLKEHSQRLGCLVGLFALAPFEWDWVESAEKYYCNLSEGDETFNPKRLTGGRRALIRYHLIKRVEKNTYLLHSLVRKFFQLKLEEYQDECNDSE